MTDDDTGIKLDGARTTLVTTCLSIMDKESNNV